MTFVDIVPSLFVKNGTRKPDLGVIHRRLLCLVHSCPREIYWLLTTLLSQDLSCISQSSHRIVPMAINIASTSWHPRRCGDACGRSPVGRRLKLSGAQGIDRVRGPEPQTIAPCTQYSGCVSRVHGRGLRLGRGLLSVSLSGGPSLRWAPGSDANIPGVVSAPCK